jgi:RNA polymerase sigma-70 factor (ECF subfamily)
VEPLSDEALARQVADGDMAGFSVLYDRSAGRIHAWAAHVLGSDRAEDAIQEVFLLLWRRAGQYDPGRGSFRAWFMAVARHEILRELRRASAGGRVAAADEIERLFERLGETGPDPALQTVDRSVLPVVSAVLQAMPAEQRRTLVLAYFGGLSQSMIAAQLGIPLGTVKKRIRLGMARLRSAVLPDEQGPPARETTIR